MKNLVPKRRFEEFKDSDPWEQRKLGELAQYRRGSFPQPYGKEEWYNGDGAMPFVQVVDVTDSLALAENTKQKISRIAQPKSIFVPKGKVIVTLQGSIGRIAITQYDCFVDRTLLIFESYNRAIDVVFWAYTMQMKFDIEKEKAPGGTIKTITKEALTDFVISLPKYKEQQRIGTFLSNLDHLITLHKRKLDKLKETKSAYLSEMFPKEGEFYPKRRFAGFTDPWEQCKLGETINYIVDNRGKNPSYYCDKGIPVIDNYMIKNNCYPNLNEASRFIDDEIYENFIRKYNEFDDTLITLVGNGIGNVTMFPKTKSVIIQNTLGLRFNENKKFMFYLMLFKNKDILLLNRGMAQPNIRQDELLDIDIKLPALDEQNKISDFFFKLDNLITLHQRKLDKLQALKQAYLSEMFI